jgi:PAS domain S-box-containing protein
MAAHLEFEIERGPSMPSNAESAASLAPKFPLNVLIVENDPLDAQMYIDFLEGSQFDLTAEVAHSAEEFVEKLQMSNYDIILADYHMGSAWTGMDAMDLLQEEGRDIPFILLTDALGDQIAVDYMKSGLADYILKDRLDRLPVAIHRALEQRAARREQLRAEHTLEQTESKFRALAELMGAAVFLQQGTQCTFVNRAAEALTGYRRSQLMQMSFWQMISEGARVTTYEQIHRAQSADLPVHCRTQITTKWGTERALDCRVKVLQMEGGISALITATPIPSVAEEGLEAERSVRGEDGARIGLPENSAGGEVVRAKGLFGSRSPIAMKVRKQGVAGNAVAGKVIGYSRAELEADERAADQLAAEQLDAILRESERRAESAAAKVRAVKPSYLQ